VTGLVGIDVGGTTIKAVAIDGLGEVLDRRTAPTPRDDVSGLRTADAVAELLVALGASAGAAGMVAPGIVDAERGVILRSQNLGWHELPLAALVGQAWGHAVPLGHDVRAGAAAEHRWGAGAGGSGLTAFLPIGTGISIAVAGAETAPITPWAGEIGMLTPFGGDGLANLESIAAGPAIARAAGMESARAVAEAVDRGDPRALEAWDAAVAVIADAAAWVTALLSPARVVIGGGVSGAGDTLLAPLRTAVARRLTILPAPRIVAATLGPWAGAIGAALLAAGPDS
jgi:glucokinase